jgi:hypothetical protein
MKTWLPVHDPWGEIEGVRDSDGDLWRPGRDSGWFCCGRKDAWRKSVDRVGDPWTSVLANAPLREVTEHGEQIGTIEITEAMVTAGRRELGKGSIASVIVAALHAGGYETTGIDQ